MTLAARHLKDRRPRKDRDVTWSRRHCDGVIAWTFWRRDQRRAIHAVSHPFSTVELESLQRGLAASMLRQCKRQLRDHVDEIDLALMEQTA